MVRAFDTRESIGQIVSEYPETRKVFDHYGIDYCCGGKIDLITASDKNNVSIEILISALNKTINDNNIPERQARNLSKITIAELIDYIISRHHTYLRRELPIIDEKLEKVINAHSEKYKESLNRLKEALTALKKDVIEHLDKEEKCIFPMIHALDSYKPGEKRFEFTEMENCLKALEDEHIEVGRYLEAISFATENFTEPEDACATYCSLYEDLRTLTDDLHEHVHLENNILFPKAIERYKTARLEEGNYDR